MCEVARANPELQELESLMAAIQTAGKTINSLVNRAHITGLVGYADGAVESLWSIDQYFEFVLVLLFSTGLSFQVPVIQLLLGQSGIVSSKQMLSVWKYVVVGSVVAAAVLTPSTDPFTQMLLAVPLMSLYLGGAALVGVFEKDREGETA